MSGITVGKVAVVCSVAVVTKNVASYEIVGAPVKHIKWWLDEATKGKLIDIDWVE